MIIQKNSFYITKQKIEYIINSIHSRNKENKKYDIKELPEIIKNLKDETINNNKETMITIDNEKITDNKLTLKSTEYNEKYSFLKITKGYEQINKVIFLNNTIYTLLISGSSYEANQPWYKPLYLYSYNLDTKKIEVNEIYRSTTNTNLKFQFFDIQFFLHENNIYIYIQKKLYLLDTSNNTLIFYIDLSNYINTSSSQSIQYMNNPFLFSYNQEIHLLGVKNPSTTNIFNYHYKIDQNKNIIFIEQLPFQILSCHLAQAILIKDDKIIVPLARKLNSTYTQILTDHEYLYVYENNQWQIMKQMNYFNQPLRLATVYPYQDDILLFYFREESQKTIQEITVETLYSGKNYPSIKILGPQSRPLYTRPNYLSPIYCFNIENKLYLNSSYILNSYENTPTISKDYERIMGYNEEYNLWEGNKYKIEKRE